MLTPSVVSALHSRPGSGIPAVGVTATSATYDGYMDTSPTTVRTLSSRLGYTFVRAGLRVRQLYGEHLATVGLLPNHHAILSILHEQGEVHQKLLAERATLDPGDIVAYLDTLQELKYISRDRDPSDRRRQLVAITKRGLAILTKADHALDLAEEQAFADLSERQCDQLAKFSTTVYERIVGSGQQDGPRAEAGTPV